MVDMGWMCTFIGWNRGRERKDREEGREQEEERVKKNRVNNKKERNGNAGQEDQGDRGRNLVHSLACLKPGQREEISLSEQYNV